MFWEFFKYFFLYIFKAKTRQRLLFLAASGLFLSSFALLVLQCTMGGLQNSLIGRGQAVQGSAVIHLPDWPPKKVDQLMRILGELSLEGHPEYLLELLLGVGRKFTPVVAHGLNWRQGVPPYLEGQQVTSTILGEDLAYRLPLTLDHFPSLISPSHTMGLLGDVPRQVSVQIEDVVSTGVPEYDRHHLWTRVELLQNLTRKRVYNTIRIYSLLEGRKGQTEQLIRQKWRECCDSEFDGRLVTWEEQNASLVWSLQLENTVMVFLFMAMNFLVAISIVSGLMIFLDRIKVDLISFWILGATSQQIHRSATLFVHILNFLTIVSGLAVGTLFLFLLDYYDPQVVPAVFVDRSIPVSWHWKSFATSFFAPYLIGAVFTHFSLRSLRRDSGDFLWRIRMSG